MSSVPVPIDDLLIHAEFVRAVARDLVRGAECADELTQQVWVAALEHGAVRERWCDRVAG